MRKKKKKRKKNEKNKAKNKVIRPWLFFIFIGVLITALISAGLLELYKYITESDRFRIKKIIIHGGEKQIKEYIKRILRLKEIDKNIILFDENELKRKIEMNPNIKTVRIRKKFPDTLIIDVKREIPFALIVMENNLFYLDSDGNIFKIKKHDDYADLPIITGLEAIDADFNLWLKKSIEIISLFLKKGIDRISELHITKYGSVHIYFTNPKIEVVLTHQIESLNQDRIIKKIQELTKILNYFANYAQIKTIFIDLDCIKNGAVVRLENING